MRLNQLGAAITCYDDMMKVSLILRVIKIYHLNVYIVTILAQAVVVHKITCMVAERLS
jgi:hypothetical protein